MAAKLQLNDISDCKIGGGSVTSIYLGNELVWPDSPTPPTPTGYSSQYLTTEMMGGGTISLADAGSNVFYYSKDNGSTWSSLTTGQTINVVTGDKVLWKASGLTISSSDGIGTIKPSASFRVYGNVMSLEYGDNFSGQTTMRDYNFLGLFYSATTLMTASNLVLPATTLTQGCYRSMFVGCRYMSAAPELPATTLADYCYYGMFRGCSILLTATPVLSATTLTSSCYDTMFAGCTNLRHITCLATDISATNCTNNWVSGVASSGTFHKAANMCDWTTGVSGVPSNWTVDPDDCGVNLEGPDGPDWGDAE